MSRKKRGFNIDVSDQDIEGPRDGPRDGPLKPSGPRVRALDDARESPGRRGPMASAIAENADALSARAEAEARIRAENDALAHEYVALKRAGLVTRNIPLDAVVTEALVRDRKPGPDIELAELVASIRDVGLSNPIRVEERDDGKFELVQGYRRLSAYRQLRDEEGEAWAEIPAGFLPRGEGIAGLYRRMVDENMVRKDLSFAEMALTAQAYAADPATGPTDVDAAVKELFKSAGYSKRSYIRNFARLLDRIGPHLRYPEEVPRNLGIALLKRLDEDERVVQQIAAALEDWEGRTIEDELGVLREATAFDALAAEAGAPVPNAAPPGGQGAGRRPRTTFELLHRGQRVKCTAGVGQLTLKVDQDLTSVERRKLEAGIAQLLDTLS
ncbi:MAG: ParB N-terminal domain-containing protein [Pseudomonadota bacterium]